MAVEVRGVIVAFLMIGLASAAAAGVTQKTTYRYFTVRGASATAIYRSITANSALKDARHTLATNEVHMASQILTKTGKECRVARANVVMSFEVHLPRLENEAALPASLRRDWRTFVAHLKGHELQHSAIWMGCAAGYDRALQGFKGQPCTALKSQMSARWTEAENICAKRNNDFDARDEKRILTLPFIRRVGAGG